MILPSEPFSGDDKLNKQIELLVLQNRLEQRPSLPIERLSGEKPRIDALWEHRHFFTVIDNARERVLGLLTFEMGHFYSGIKVPFVYLQAFCLLPEVRGTLLGQLLAGELAQWVVQQDITEVYFNLSRDQGKELVHYREMAKGKVIQIGNFEASGHYTDSKGQPVSVELARFWVEPKAVVQRTEELKDQLPTEGIVMTRLLETVNGSDLNSVPA